MAHHGIDSANFEDFNKEIKKATDPYALMNQPSFRKPPMIPNLGATGEFPDGKITDDDEGEIRVGITRKDDTVIIDFGKPIAWIGFTKEQAREIGKLLIQKADDGALTSNAR